MKIDIPALVKWWLLDPKTNAAGIAKMLGLHSDAAGKDSTVSLVNPNVIDGYRYNPIDGVWYRDNERQPYYELPGGRPPTTWRWNEPAEPSKQDDLNRRRLDAIEYEKLRRCKTIKVASLTA